MRGYRVLVIAACGFAFAGAAEGCATHPLSHQISGGYDAPAAHRHAPAPANPDLGTVMERFYQQVEGAHWRLAYAMLTPRYQAALSQAQFVARYERYADLDVSLRQDGDRVVVATIGAKDRGPATTRHRFAETTTLAWDGEDWRVDRVARRELSASGTR